MPMTKKANTPKLKKLWRKIEKSEVPKMGKARAHRAANAAIARLSRNPRRKNTSGSKAPKTRGRNTPAARTPRKGKTARGAVNIKVNVMSKNPAARKKTARRRGSRYNPTPRFANRFVLCAHKRNGDRLYYTGVGGEFSDMPQRAVIYNSFHAASKKARELMGKGMKPEVKSLEVKRV